jgi:hypothetical protein
VRFDLFQRLALGFRDPQVEKAQAPTAITPYSQKVPACPRTPTRVRKVTATNRLNAQLVTVTALMAAPRTFKG